MIRRVTSIVPFQITYADIGGPSSTAFLDNVRMASAQPPWKFNFTSQARYMMFLTYQRITLERLCSFFVVEYLLGNIYASIV